MIKKLLTMPVKSVFESQATSPLWVDLAVFFGFAFVAWFAVACVFGLI